MSRAWTCRGRLRSPGRGSFSTGGAGRGWRGTGQAPAPGNAQGGGWARGAGLSHVPAPGNRSGVLSRAAPAPRPHPGTPPLGTGHARQRRWGTQVQPPNRSLLRYRCKSLARRGSGPAPAAVPVSRGRDRQRGRAAPRVAVLRPPAFPSSPGLGGDSGRGRGVGGAEALGSPAPPAARPAEACARPAVT